MKVRAWNTHISLQPVQTTPFGSEQLIVTDSVRNCRLPASNLLLSLRTGSHIFVDASPDACNISEEIFFL